MLHRRTTVADLVHGFIVGEALAVAASRWFETHSFDYNPIRE